MWTDWGNISVLMESILKFENRVQGTCVIFLDKLKVRCVKRVLCNYKNMEELEKSFSTWSESGHQGTFANA